MKYVSVNDILTNADTKNASNFLKELWYAKAEEIFILSNDYFTFKQQLLFIQSVAPINWQLHWDGQFFSLSKKIMNQSLLTLKIKDSGHIDYRFH
ncbi:hypothetical protein [Metabacillus malikii]|uniref:Uncharacterized protein n=1 Tax=Metabacillus malikii TaxID=1504265 RepID=A0ABT9ZEM9_9BACI|nr:hypothetical protein [Metabacillus malikii]MDQ0230028.1 hypothetical protein [Metabacillus malikii]